MTDKEYQDALESLKPRLEKYAELLVKKGAALQKGQELAITAAPESFKFARMVVHAGYEAGAKHVTMIWDDQVVAAEAYKYVDEKWFEKYPEWKVKQLDGLAEEGAALLFLESNDPEVFKGLDSKKIAMARKARNTQCKAWRRGMDFGFNTWCIGGVPATKWAQKVFPNLEEKEALIKLWDAVLKVARITEDPLKSWEEHDAQLEARKDKLNELHFDSLHYASSNGTDFIVGLADKHLWDGGSGKTQSGTNFFPNIPTEEVFSVPDRRRAEGKLVAALPLVYAGTVIRDFWFEFKQGKIIDYGASQGKEALDALIQTDDGSCRLGEVALVSRKSPIRESGLLFYSTLFDENASCHFAVGKAFPECYEGGFDLSPEELMENGVNNSATHVDFMVGSDDLQIIGTKENGEQISVFENGVWAL